MSIVFRLMAAILIVSLNYCSNIGQKGEPVVERNEIVVNDYFQSEDSVLFRRLGKEFGFNDISNGYDSLGLRIWIWGHDSIIVASIESHQGVNTFKLINFHFEAKNDTVWAKVTRRVGPLNPALGWASIFTNVRKYHIHKLTPNKIFTEAGFHNEGRYELAIEISNFNGYKLFKIIDPSYFRKSYVAAKNIYEFLNEMNGLFNYKIYIPVDSLYWEGK